MFRLLSLSHDLIKACVKGREYSQSHFASCCRKSSVIDSLLNHFGYLNQKSENLKINGLLKETSHCVFQTHTPLVRSFIRLIQSFVHREKSTQARCYFIIWKALQYKNRRGQKPDAAVFTFYGHISHEGIVCTDQQLKSFSGTEIWKIRKSQLKAMWTKS